MRRAASRSAGEELREKQAARGTARERERAASAPDLELAEAATEVSSDEQFGGAEVDAGNGSDDSSWPRTAVASAPKHGPSERQISLDGAAPESNRPSATTPHRL